MTSDNQLLYQGDMILCTVNNAQYYGGGFQIIMRLLMMVIWIYAL